MVDFVLRDMTDIVYGRGEEAQTGRLIREFGGSRVLVHHAGEAFVLPLIEKLRGILEAESLVVSELGGVVPNPRLSKVYAGIALCRREQVDFILAVGGGSVIDSAKAIAVGVPYEGDVWDFFDVKGKPKVAIPIGVVSTFAGTGSETTVGTMITKEEQKLKRGMEDNPDRILIRPKFAILNPELTFTVPRFQTACGVADIVSHMLENFFTPDLENDFSDQFTYAGLKTAAHFGPMVLEEPENYEARGALMLLSTYAINGLMKVGRRGDWNCHSIEHEMSGEWDIPHGAGLAVVTPNWMRAVYQDHLETFVKLAVHVFGVPYDGENPEWTALEGIAATEDFFYRQLGLPATLRELGVPEEAMTDDTLRKVAGQVFYYGQKASGRMHPMVAEDIFAVLKMCR